MGYIIVAVDSEGNTWYWNQKSNHWTDEKLRASMNLIESNAHRVLSQINSTQRLLDADDRMDSIEVVKHNDS